MSRSRAVATADARTSGSVSPPLPSSSAIKAASVNRSIAARRTPGASS